MNRLSFMCTYCEANFIIEHDEVNEVSKCPFCGEPLDLSDEDEEPLMDEE